MILVTGGTGLLGSHLLLELCSGGHKVRALKRPSSDTAFVETIFEFYHKKELFAGIEWVEGDLCDLDSLQKAITDVDQIYHCAATVTFSPRNRQLIFENNVAGTANLINVAIKSGVKKFCHVSSIAALGKDAVVTEKSAWDDKQPHSVYGKTKHEAELEAWRGIAEGLDTIIVNPSVIIGPWKANAGIGKYFRQIIAGLKYYTGGSNGFVDVRDVAKLMVLLMHSPTKNERFLVSSENVSFRQLSAMIAAIAGAREPSVSASKLMTDIAWRLAAAKSFFTRKKPDFDKDTARIAQSTTIYSNEKIASALNFTFIPVRQSLEHYYTFYKVNH